MIVIGSGAATTVTLGPMGAGPAEAALPAPASPQPGGLFYDELPPAGAGESDFALDLGIWSNREITYRFVNSTGDLTATAQRDAFRQALALWSDVTPLRFREVTDSADIDVSWAAGDHGDGSPFDGANGVLAHGFYPPPTNGIPLAGDIHFDDAETWSTSPRPDGTQPIDLVTVAAHEIGHALGLQHSGDPTALMFPSYSQSHRFLANDDILGIRAKYAPAVKWSDYMCVGTEVCAFGDVNGDGRSDAVTFIKDTQAEPGRHDAWVALSTGTGFAPAMKWSDYMCVGAEQCFVADVNGDGRADAISIIRTTQAEPNRNDIWVAISSGTGFAPAVKWSDYMCVGTEVCAFGDVNGDGRSDAVTFIKDTQAEPGRHDAWVALSTGTGFAPAMKWSDYMCVGAEQCFVADVNGDGRADAISIIRTTQAEPNRNDIWVAISSGTGFAPAVKWSDYMCVGTEVCAFGDVNGDGRSDAVTFIKDTQAEPGRHDMWVALSTGTGFAPAMKWSDYMCVGAEQCFMTDVNGDRNADAIAVIGTTAAEPNRNDIWVALN